jgi:GDPmannose 4,6-dehydratase
LKALIFGAGGQDGYYLARILRASGLTPISISRRAGNDSLQADISDYSSVESLIKAESPAYVFHLAANSTTRHEALFENHETISTGTLNVLEALKRYSAGTKVFLSGSGLQFENKGEPISEQAPFAATSAYSVARIQSVYAARYYRRLGVKAYVGYFFHHDSPRRGEKHVSQMIAQTAARIRDGSHETLEIGDVTVRKEWGFAGDIMQGAWTLVQQDTVFEAAIGTGRAYSIAEFVDACFSRTSREWREHVAVREGFVPEYNCLVSDPSTMFSLGWRPAVDLNALAAMMVDEAATPN